MKKYLIAALFIGLGTLGCAQLVTIDFTLGILTTSGGGSPLSDGALIQVISSADNAFAAPTSGAFIGGDDVLQFSGSFDSGTTGTPGSMLIALTNINAASDYLMVRWFPTLTNVSVSPGFSTSYGQYSSLDDISWVAPATGSLSYSLVTISAGGSTANSAGYASLTTAAIPEPSTYAAIFGALALGLVAYRRRQQAA